MRSRFSTRRFRSCMCLRQESLKARIMSHSSGARRIVETDFRCAAGATITDVIDPSKSARRVVRHRRSIVSLWRFDPDARKLRVTLNPAQSHVRIAGAFADCDGAVAIRAIGGLDFAWKRGRADRLARHGDRQRSATRSVSGGQFFADQLGGFPGEIMPALQAQIPGLTVRRAFRYADAQAHGRR